MIANNEYNFEEHFYKMVHRGVRSKKGFNFFFRGEIILYVPMIIIQHTRKNDEARSKE